MGSFEGKQAISQMRIDEGDDEGFRVSELHGACILQTVEAIRSGRRDGVVVLDVGVGVRVGVEKNGANKLRTR